MSHTLNANRTKTPFIGIGECIDNSDCLFRLTEGKVYLLFEHPTTGYGDCVIVRKDDKGESSWFYKRRFTLLNSSHIKLAKVLYG